MVRLFWFSQVMTVWNQDAQCVVAASYVDPVARMLLSRTAPSYLILSFLFRGKHIHAWFAYLRVQHAQGHITSSLRVSDGLEEVDDV